MGKTVYEVEEFLKKPLELEKKVRDLEDHIASLKFIVEDTTTHLSPTAGRNPSKTSDSFEKVMLEIVTQEARLKEMKQAQMVARQGVESLISRIDKAKEREALRLRYVRGLKWDSVAYMLELDGHYIYNLRAKAMKSAEKIWEQQKVTYG